MKKLITLIICLFTLGVYSQVYVSPNTYIFSNNQVVFIKQDLELNSTTSNFYLRNNSQLLQGTTTIGSNKGVGNLSIYQEGTVNNYQYNYWCSPVGNTLTSTSTNNPFGISQLKDVTGLITYNDPIILAMNNYDGINSPLSIAPYWIYKFTTANTYAQWSQVGANNTLNAGEGFTMKGTSGSGSAQRYDFRGKANDGTLLVPITNNNSTLTGNPYPSAIDLNMLLTDITNSSIIDGTALFWEHDKTANSHYLAQYRGGYGVYNGTSGLYTPATFYTYNGSGTQGPVASTPLNNYERRFSPIGQGFMLRGIGNGDIQIKNSYRVFVKEGASNNSQFERNNEYGFYDDIPNLSGTDYTQISKAPTPHIKINISLGDQAVRQVVIAFLDNSIDGLDKADSKSPDDNLPIDSYLYLNNSKYVHSTTNFNINKVFPIGFNNNVASTFKIQVSGFVNFSGADNVYLHDKLLNEYHDIKNSEYSLLLPIGVINDRFEITFQNSTLGIDDSDIIKDFIIYQNIKSNLLTIKNPNQFEIQSIDIYDILGKSVLSKSKIGNNSTYEFNTSNLSNGVYIVKVKLENDTIITKKISN